MITEMLDRIIETDIFTSAKRTVDTQRYAIMRCREKYGASIDENEIHLFLIGATAQTLTKEQQDFIRECKSEMHRVPRDTFPADGIRRTHTPGTGQRLQRVLQSARTEPAVWDCF